MLDRKIKVLLIGCGGMGRMAVRFMVERGIDLVAVAEIAHLGEDAGELAEIGPIGCTLENVADLGAIIDRTQPDIVLDATDTLWKSYPNLRVCLEHGCSVITLADQAYFGAVADPKIYAELDAIAKEKGGTLVGLGIQDVNFSNACVVMSGNCHKLEKIYGENWCILDYAGPTESPGIGLTEEEFWELRKDDMTPHSPFTYSLYQIADELELTVTEEINSKIEPLFAKADYEFSTPTGEYSGIVPKGRVIGSHLCTTLKTEQGISLVGSFYYSFAQEGTPHGTHTWRFEGEPTFEVVTPKKVQWGTPIDIVNRIPDVINAPPGFLTVKDLPKPRYKWRPFEEYVNA